MIKNIVDIDYESKKVSLRYRHGALVLFDFEAAFPSVSHDYLFQVLGSLGIPAGILASLRCFYVNNMTYMKIKGIQEPSIVCKSGIRQGCPLSPLLFVMVVDLLLRKLALLFPDDVIRAFADDTAMIMHDFPREANRVLEVFTRFAAVSNLKLNIPKTIIIP